MISGYNIVSLNDMIAELGENTTKGILSTFSCPKNLDVEHFLKNTAIVFEKQGISRTRLIFCQHKGKLEFVAYFAIASKNFSISAKTKRLSSNWKRRLAKYGKLDTLLNQYIVPAPLIAQLGKNFNNGLNELISGDELLKLACDTVKAGQRFLGGKIVYLECEDEDRLTTFYSDNGFVNFGRRMLDKSEKNELGTDYLVQMLKYLG